MTREQELVQQILEFIANDEQQRTPALEDVAEQYAEICAAVNDRLFKCAAFLDKGMRSEAVHEAQVPPPLLSVVDAINFKEVGKWRGLCEELGLIAFPPLHLEIVDRLREEYAKEAALAPLLKKYRRLVYQGDQEGCIQLLREIRSRDAGNPVWAQNLRPLEEKELPRLREQVQEALARDDLPRLSELRKELTHPQRAAPPPRDLMAELDKALHAERERETLSEGQKTAARIKQALVDQDASRMTALLEQWTKLKEDAAFRATPAMEAPAEQARTWLEAESARQDREARFRQALDAMRELLASRPSDAATVQQRWGELQAMGGAIPGDIEQGVSNAFARIQQKKAGRRRLAAGAVAVLALLAAVALVLVGLHHRRLQSRRANVARLTALLEDARYEDLDKALERIAAKNPSLYRSKELQGIRAKTREVLEQRAEQDSRFRGAMDKLKRIKSAGFRVPEDEIRRLLDEARGLAPGPVGEQEVDSWRLSWDLWRSRKQEEIDGRLQQATAAVRTGLQQDRNRKFTSFAAEERVLARLQERRRQADPLLAKAAPEAVRAFNEAAAQLDAWAKDLAERRGAQEKTTNRYSLLRRQLRTAPPDFEEYGKLLGQFVTEFPDAEETTAFRRALDQLGLYRQAAALQGFSLSGLPADERELPEIQSLIRAAGTSKESVWAPDLAACADYAARLAELRNKLMTTALGNQQMMKLQVLYYRRKGQGQWLPLYYLKPIRSRDEQDEAGETHTAYWGEVYHNAKPDQKPWLEHTSRVFPNKLSTRDYDIRVQRRAQDNLVPHAKFLLKLLADANEADELDVYLLQAIVMLVQDKDMELVPKGLLLKQIVHMMQEFFGGKSPEVAQMVQLVDRMNTDVPWMNHMHPQVLAAREGVLAATVAFPEIPPIVRRLRMNRSLLAKALSRRVRCVGSLQPQKPSGLEPVLTTSATPGAVWVIVGGLGGAAPRFKAAAEARGDGTLRIRDDAVSDVFGGQLLFAPGDGSTEEKILKAVIDPADRRRVEWPSSWPVNAR